MKNDMISIIIPIYNAEKYIGKLLESVENQKYDNYEVLMINDGSTDKSEKICLKYVKNNSNFKYFYKENSGVSNTRNFGIELANGKYICFVDADDLIDVNYLKDFTDALKAEKAQMCCCKVEKFEKNDVNLNSEIKSKIERKYEKKNKYNILYEEYLGYACNKLFEKNIIINNNIKFRSDISMAEDLLFSFEYLKRINKVICINKRNYKYRRQALSASLNMKNIKWFSIFKTLDFMINNKEEYNQEIYNKLMYSYVFYLYQAKYRLSYIKSYKEYDSLKKQISLRIKEINFKNLKLSKKQKYKIYIYKYFNKIAFKLKLLKNRF